MAKKKGEVQHIHPSDSDSDSDEQINDSEPEHQSEPQPPKPSTQISNSSDDSDSDSEDEESEPEPELEPLETVATKSKLISEVKGKGPAVGVKRGAEKAVKSKNVKKPKIVETLVNKTGKSENGVSKNLFQRVFVFSEDDEIVLLKGMLDLTAKEKVDLVQIDEFVDFINKLLHSDVTKEQVLSKIKRLKGNYVRKAGHAGKFSKQHDREVYELSNKIWGNVDVENNNNVDGGLEKKLTKIEVAELELCVMRWDYMAEKARLIVAAKKAEL